jgi:hypothetical protein
MPLQNFTLIELGTVMVSVIGGVAMLCGVIARSRCDKVRLCCGLIDCHRKVLEETLDVEQPRKVSA